MGVLRKLYIGAILFCMLVTLSTAGKKLTKEQEEAADILPDEKDIKDPKKASEEDDESARGNKPACSCPPPQKRNLLKIPNSSKVCGYELAPLQLGGQAKNCDPQMLYRCPLVAMDEAVSAREMMKCDPPSGFCRPKGQQTNARICSQYEN